MDKSAYKNVFVFVEQREGVVQSVALELLGKARELADALQEKWWHCCPEAILKPNRKCL